MDYVLFYPIIQVMHSQPKKYNLEEKAVISLKSFQIVKVNFNLIEFKWGQIEASNDCNLSIQFKIYAKENSENIFGLHFTVKLNDDSDNFNLNVEAFAEFIVKGVIVNDEFTDSKLVTANAPAIVFPYLRSYITNFCQNSGFNPIILPGFNFNNVEVID